MEEQTTVDKPVNMNAAMFLMAMCEASQKKPVFVHSGGTQGGARWHHGDCFPDEDTCAIPSGTDLDEQEQ